MPTRAAAVKKPKSPPAPQLPAAEYVAVSKLRPWVKNPRKNDHAVDQIAASIRRWGFGAPLLARRANGEVIAGHTRLKAAIKLGLLEVPVRYLDLGEKEAHQLALADNRLGELASWDDGQLLEILKGFSPADQLAVGWSDKDLAALERASGKQTEVKEDLPGELPKVPITKLGDVWTLGRHRLICGDSTTAATYQRVLGDRKVGLMVTDPPYGVNAVVGTTDPRHQKGDPRKRYAHNGDKESVIANDDLTGDKLEEFLRAVWTSAAPALAPGAAWYVWFAGTNSMPFMRAAELLGGFRHQLVCVKPHFVFGRSDYHYRHEPCLYGWTAGGGHAWLGGRSQTSVFEVKLDKAVGSSVHPSVKPVELYAIPMRNHLGADGSVLDPFAGTGPAFSAAEQLERTCYGIELSPGYCDVIVERWQKLTGGQATRDKP